jgi:catechol 2,3-dioxygenase-like lactoylglutathione lyase family enzyme
LQSTVTKLSNATVYATMASTNINRAQHFYRDILGFDVERANTNPDNLMVRCGNQTGLAIYERPDQPECDTTLASFIVEDLEETMADLRSNGVKFEDYDLPYLKTENGIATQGPTKASWFKDPDGNTLSLVQM